MVVVNLEIQLSISKLGLLLITRMNITFFQIGCEVLCCEPRLLDYAVGWKFLNLQIRKVAFLLILKAKQTWIQ